MSYKIIFPLSFSDLLTALLCTLKQIFSHIYCSQASIMQRAAPCNVTILLRQLSHLITQLQRLLGGSDTHSHRYASNYLLCHTILIFTVINPSLTNLYFSCEKQDIGCVRKKHISCFDNPVCIIDCLTTLPLVDLLSPRLF